MAVLGTMFRALERISALRQPVPGARVSWHSAWDPEVSAFFQQLGGEGWLPEHVLAMLVSDQSIHPKRVALLTRDGEPWALVPLRWTTKYWQPLLRGVAEPFPDFIATHAFGDVFAALNVGVYVRFGTQSPANFRNLRWSTTDTSYDLSLEQSPERYWRQTERWKSVVQARKRSAAFDLVRDDPAATSWTVERWHRRWASGRAIEVSAKWRDRIAFDQWGLTSGAVRSWALRDRDRDRWVAGCIGVIRDGSMMLQTVIREPEYDWYNVGTRIFAEAVLGAYGLGLREVSFGAGFEYKRWWARPGHVRHTFIVAPWPVHAANWLVDRASAWPLKR